MEQAVALRDRQDTQPEAHPVAADEVIDAFDHVIAALDEVYAVLAQFADPKEVSGIETTDRRAARAARSLRASEAKSLHLRDLIRHL